MENLCNHHIRHTYADIMSSVTTRLISFVAALLATAWFVSCEDNTFDRLDYTRSGEKVTLKVKLSLPEMETKTRADLNANSLNQVNSVWIRTYSAETGQATSKWIKREGLNSVTTETTNQVSISTESGPSYIVAVANVDNMGVKKGDIANPQKLSVLLESANTWQDFLDIAVVSPSDNDKVYAPDVPLPMAGCYSDLKIGGTHPEPSRIDEWQKKDFQPYFIPASDGAVDFTDKGAIHLRRLVSHINFNFIPGENVSVTVNSYQVMNAPKFSWLYERPATNGMLTNFGDQATDTDAANYYADVPQYSNQYKYKKTITLEDNTTVEAESFDFWQAENKHTGTSATYQARDEKNGTLFTSLTGTSWTANNEASYVLVSCTVDYKNQIKTDDEGAIDETNGEAVYRTGEVVYLIHLGYVMGENVEEKSKDFNCFRNVDYTYNVTVNGVNDIRVDAYATDETYHGEEGVVSDLKNKTIELDAHYHAFNIQLTQTELTDDFGFLITTYDNGKAITISEANAQETTTDNKHVIYDNAKNIIDEKYYNWIELRPTTGEFVLAEYKPRFGENSDGATFLLTDLQKGWDSMTDKMISSTGYYTVFVNEYTYEPMYTGTDSYADEQNADTGEQNAENAIPNWMHYVNQNPRRFYVKVKQKESPDENSIYMRSKYGVSQASLQTYYSTNIITPANGEIPKGTAIGVERYNETEGLNICYPGNYGTDASNGRYNAAQWLSKSKTDIKVTSATPTADRPLWSVFVDQTKPMEIPAVTGSRAQGGPALPARTGANCVKLPALAAPTTTRTATFSDPQSNATYSIDVYNACMSRNRDNNGNGRIDPEELRWYIPAMGKYLRLLIGAPSLSNPVMNFSTDITLPKVDNGENKYVTGWGTVTVSNSYLPRYMYATSDGARVLWAMEGMSTSTWSNIQEWSVNKSFPWQVRCIRNLGTNLNTVTTDEKVVMAYDVDETEHTVTFTYFDPRGIRANKLSGNGTATGTMPTHNIISDFNKPYKKFEYTTTNIEVTGTDKSLTGLQGYIQGNPCSVTGTGWRVPNQTELAILLNLKLLTQNGSYLSCTYNYFNQKTGEGGGYTNAQNYFLGMLGSGATNGNRGTLLEESNLGFSMYVRCVRDVD